MSVYSSDLVAAVRKAAGNTGNNMMKFIGKLLWLFRALTFFLYGMPCSSFNLVSSFIIFYMGIQVTILQYL